MEKVIARVYDWLDDQFCTLAFFGYRPPWYKEWWTRGRFTGR